MSLLAHQAQLMAESEPVVLTTWDPSAKGSSVVLSDSDMRATKAATGWNSVYGTVGKSSGKWQFEVVHISGTGVNRPFAAIADKTNIAQLVSNYCGNNAAGVQESVGYWGNGTLYWRLSSATGSSAATATGANDVITVCLDLTLATPEAYFYRNGTLVATRALPTGKTWYPATSVQGGGMALLVPAGLAHPVAGFNNWG